MSPVGWVGLACLGGFALFDSIEQPWPATTLESFAAEETVIVRLPARHFVFPVLQASVHLPDGWTYLSTTSPTHATNPTFINEHAQSVVTLTSSHSLSESAVAIEPEPERFEDCTIDWFQTPKPNRSLTLRVTGIEIPFAWPEYRYRQIGLLQREGVAVQLAVFGPKPGQEQAIRKFCQGIGPITAN